MKMVGIAWRYLVARPLAPVRRKLCATPDYFQRKGIPQTPADLVVHRTDRAAVIVYVTLVLPAQQLLPFGRL